jgi:hypothetical protein
MREGQNREEMAPNGLKMGRDAVNNCRKLTRPQVPDLVDRIHGSDGEGGDSRQANGTWLVRDMAMIRGWEPKDGDYGVARQVVGLSESREMKEGIDIHGLREAEAEALALAECCDNELMCVCNVSEGLVADCLDFETIQALDCMMKAIGCSPMHSDRECNRDSDTQDLKTMWPLVGQAALQLLGIVGKCTMAFWQLSERTAHGAVGWR